MLKRARNVSQTRLLGTEVRMNECQKKITIGVKKDDSSTCAGFLMYSSTKLDLIVKH